MFVESTAATCWNLSARPLICTFLSQTDRTQPDRRQSAVAKRTGKQHASARAPSWKRQLSDLLHAGSSTPSTRRILRSICCFAWRCLKFLTQEISTQFANCMLEAKEWIRGRGAHFEHTEQAHVIKARLAELQADRRNMFPQSGPACVSGNHGYRRESAWRRSRKALFGDEARRPTKF